jgi:hypothetical protein
VGTGSQYWARRAIWALLAVAVIVPLLVPMYLPMIVSPPARALYDHIEAIPPDKIVILCCDWEAGTKGENAPQTEALIRHCFRRDIKFAIFGWAYPPGPELAEQIAEQLAPDYGKRYGRDWVNWGFKIGVGPMLRGLAKDIPAIVREDTRGTPIAKVPMMRGVRDIHDVGMVVDITPAGTVPTLIRYIYGIYRTPIGFACTGVMAPEAFPYLDSGQLVGILKGLVGAAEYEKLVGYHGEPSLKVYGYPYLGQATTWMPAQSLAHVLIIVLVIIGNIQFLAARRRSGRG